MSPLSHSETPSARSTPTRVQSHAAAESINYDVQTFGSSLPVKVMEALTMADGKGKKTSLCYVFQFSFSFPVLVDAPCLFVRVCWKDFIVSSSISTEHFCVSVLVPLADDQISVKVNESGWAWMVCGERLIIWKICQTAVAKVQFSPSSIKKIHKLPNASPGILFRKGIS